MQDVSTSTSLVAPQRTIGLDLGDGTSTLCVLDSGGHILEETSLPTSRTALRSRFRAQERSRVVLEACGQSHWVARLLQSFGHEVFVVNPRQLRLISQSVKKCDRNDARLLARVGRSDVGLLQPTFLRSDASMQARALLRARRNLVQMRTRLVNSVRSTAKTFGSKLRSASAEGFVAAATKGLPAQVLKIVQPQLLTLTFLEQQIGAYDQEIERLGRAEFPQTQLLRQIFGVGPQIALAFVVAIDDPKRFRRSRDVGPYLGLTPRKDQSGDSDPQLPISKHGDGSLRSLLVTAATHILRKNAPDSDLRRHGERIAGRGTTKERGKARIAVARKLAVVMHRLLLTGEAYQPLREAAQSC
jgi:transposase